jgi:endonuclease III
VVGVSPDALIAVRSAPLERALKAGGIVPAVRATRLKSIARTVRDEFGGDLRGALARLPVTDAHRLLRRFPGIGAPGADRILLFAALAPVAAVPSACPHVLTRIESGGEPARYSTAYREAQRALEALAPTVEARRRAYLLLKRHGQELCKRSNPRCTDCPIAARCAYARQRLRRRASRRAVMD